MRFDREIAVGGLDKIRAGNPFNFQGHGALIGEGADMFDHRIGKANLKRLIREVAHAARISGDGNGIGQAAGGDGGEV